MRNDDISIYVNVQLFLFSSKFNCFEMLKDVIIMIMFQNGEVEMGKSEKILMIIVLVGTIISGSAIFGMVSAKKIEKVAPESVIERVSSESESRAAKESEVSESMKQSSEVPEVTTTPESTDSAMISSAETNVKSNAVRFGTTNQSLWPIRESILNNIYGHIHSKSDPTGFAMWLVEKPNGFYVYAGHQMPGSVIGTVTDNGDGSFTYVKDMSSDYNNKDNQDFKFRA